MVSLWEELLRQLPSMPPDPGGRTRTAIADALLRELPEEGLSNEALVEHARQLVFDHSIYPGSPGFMAYVVGPGTVPGALADLLAAGLNQNVGGWQLAPGATEIELHLTQWFASRFGLPEGSGGLILSGGSMANFTGLKLARDARGGLEVRKTGVRGQAPMAVYVSEEIHGSVVRAADMLGIGTDMVRKIGTDESLRMRVDLLERAIGEDVLQGVRPIAVVACAGSVGTGAVDPFEAIADVCARHGAWLHVDAAYGGGAAFCDPEGGEGESALHASLRGIARADSIAFDPHKWLYTPISGGCLLVRDMAALASSFGIGASYIYQDKERTGRGPDYAFLGPQFTRAFSAFKIWFSLLAHGTKAYSRRIAHDAALARYLGELVQSREDFELAAPVGMSICCFRYAPNDVPVGEDREGWLDRLNAKLVTELQLEGRAYCSNAVIRGRFALRACIINFRTEAKDVELLIERAAELGSKLHRAMREEAANAARVASAEDATLGSRAPAPTP